MTKIAKIHYVKTIKGKKIVPCQAIGAKTTTQLAKVTCKNCQRIVMTKK